MPRPSRRDDVVDSAVKLFAEEGFHAVGIDRILSEGGLAKMTLYRHFDSKQALILASLDARNRQILAWFGRKLAESNLPPPDRPLALFDALEEWIGGETELGPFNGCMFVRAAGEFPDLADPIHKAAAEAKENLRATIVSAVELAGYLEAEDLAGELMVLKEGATVLAQIHGSAEPVQHARRTARARLRAWLRA
ncbi:transcriptional regulator, TetR family protein [Tepidicaulis marinus]|jgi:AcrR family transcriptional regulator|uniref:Transcriptional regulator, TetR family protein n=1 Tax=Tepidicaulis marinus TaxID=1333998 RepID=A0A081B6Q6_9HYPH|nr:TetR/AcrR family transcriptional regulator [Tepidicaulis marinus]GAK43724.1 transcriptional regulator, TetR family protein [Tepidicaulis marinus]